ncbi:MAG: TonB-dependent receptor [Bacteroidales bacterium]|nr:TonB-dependent receptor [Bacteroidales bacterium]
MLFTFLTDALLIGSSILSDTCDVRPLNEVEVVQEQRFREVLSGRRLEGADLERLSALSVADVLHQFAGIQVRDYGGIGGIKTINVRSMGSQHTGICYDGTELGNAQNGQIDLGQLSMDNIESVQFCPGQRSAIFQSASDFAHASTVYLRTRTPHFALGQRRHLRFRAQGGSSALLRLSALWQQRLGSRHTLSLHVEGLSADGRYPFRYRRLNYDGSVAYDTTATRRNGDVQSLLAEVNVTGSHADAFWRLKGYTYHSNRGIPGAIVNNVWRRGERQSDHNTFFQGQWQRDLGPTYSMRVQGKLACYGTHYVNRDTTQYMTDVCYTQLEGYCSTSHVWSPLPWWSFSLSYDYRYNRLESDAPLFDTVHRHQHLLSAATAASWGAFRAQFSLLQTWSRDHHPLRSAPLYDRRTPALMLHWQALDGLSIQAFAKRSFRLPTFNDLYYTDLGNALLRPETADQYNIGARYAGQWQSLGRWSLQCDLYHNAVRDKIIAYPKGQQFRWTMLNLGRVSINGADLQLDLHRDLPRWGYSLSAQYTYQQAIDVTSAADSYYRDQIPYIPHHSGTLTVTGSYLRRWILTYIFTYVGERYSQQENISYNHLQPWYTSDVHLQYEQGRYRVLAEVLNALDQQYDVIANYPMPGRNFRLSICIHI